MAHLGLYLGQFKLTIDRLGKIQAKYSTDPIISFKGKTVEDDESGNEYTIAHRYILQNFELGKWRPILENELKSIETKIAEEKIH